MLTDSQLKFAQMLGRELAHIWLQRQGRQPPEDAQRREKSEISRSQDDVAPSKTPNGE
jgi:hypothetical protein